jgi:glycosyltransferase involved in cell wall biosynthesis
LLDAIAQLHQRKFPIRLRAVGPFETSDYEVAIHRRAAELGVNQLIDWVGFTSDIESELEQMDLFVLPSLFGEGLPMVVLEAMAAGVPVVATRVEGVPEAIEDGVSGLIAEPSHAEDLARCIARMVCGEVDWFTIRRHALARHARHFSDRIMAARVAEVYRSLLDE